MQKPNRTLLPLPPFTKGGKSETQIGGPLPPFWPKAKIEQVKLEQVHRRSGPPAVYCSPILLSERGGEIVSLLPFGSLFERLWGLPPPNLERNSV